MRKEAEVSIGNIFVLKAIRLKEIYCSWNKRIYSMKEENQHYWLRQKTSWIMRIPNSGIFIFLPVSSSWQLILLLCPWIVLSLINNLRGLKWDAGQGWVASDADIGRDLRRKRLSGRVGTGLQRGLRWVASLSWLVFLWSRRFVAEAVETSHTSAIPALISHNVQRWTI